MMKKIKFIFTASWNNKKTERIIEFFHIGNDALEQAKVLFETHIDSLSTIIAIEPIERDKSRFLDLFDGYRLFGFDSEEEMKKVLIEITPEYSGLFSDCNPKEEWVERNCEMEYPHHGSFWYNSYNGDKYCKNHFRWSFETAVEAIGNPQYIIVSKTK